MIISHALLFALALSIIWILSGSIIGATDRVAKRYNKPGFAVGFFVLGLMTSIGEMSVAVNSTIRGVPAVSAGNLVGASIVIFLLIIPLLAITAKSVTLGNALLPSNLILSLCIIAVPALLALDGTVIPREGFLIILLYIALIYRLRKYHTVEETIEATVEEVREELLHKRHATTIDFLHIGFGALIIFFAGNILVEESVYFTTLFGVPTSVAGLLILSIGTNTPELIIGIRSALSRHTDIAFGDYLGSAAANSLLFAALPLFNGTFLLDTGEFSVSFFVLALGLLLFFFLARSKNELSRREGFVMLSLYVVFLAVQIVMVV